MIGAAPFTPPHAQSIDRAHSLDRAASLDSAASDRPLIDGRGAPRGLEMSNLGRWALPAFSWQVNLPGQILMSLSECMLLRVQR